MGQGRCSMIIIKGVVILAAAGGLALIILELMAGCGQVTYLPDNTWKSNECLFLPHEINYGRW
jgi:hypothetical protein